jgi:hypothetical protein
MVFPPTTVEVRGETTWKFTPAEDARRSTRWPAALRRRSPRRPAGRRDRDRARVPVRLGEGALADEAQLDALCRVRLGDRRRLADAARRHAPLSGAEPSPRRSPDRRR